MENQMKQRRKQNWFQKQFSSRNSQDDRPKEGAYEAAVAAAAFAVQSIEGAKTTKLKSASRKENGRIGMLHSNRITSQFSFKKTTTYAVENSKDKLMKQKSKEVERVYSAAKPSSKSAVIPIAPGDNAEWYDKLKSVVACGSDKMPKTND